MVPRVQKDLSAEAQVLRSFPPFELHGMQQGQSCCARAAGCLQPGHHLGIFLLVRLSFRCTSLHVCPRLSQPVYQQSHVQVEMP